MSISSKFATGVTVSQTTQVLVAGVGNIFLGDDGFGVEVVRRLSQIELVDCVRVVDFGTRGLDLTYALLNAPPCVILVDAVPRGGTPGELSLLEVDVNAPPETSAAPLQMHGMDPASVLNAVHALGGRVDRMYVVGCEPMPLNSEHDLLAGLSPAVQAAVGKAVDLLLELLARLGYLNAAKTPTSLPESGNHAAIEE